jgi:hypothetical protein
LTTSLLPLLVPLFYASAVIATFPSLLPLLLHHFMPFLLASQPRALTAPKPIIFARIKRYIHTVYSSLISSKSIPKQNLNTIELNITISLPQHLTIPLVQLTMPITIHTAILLARIIIHTRPAVIRTFLIPFAATVIACAKPRAVARVDVAAFVEHVADFVGATLAAARAAAGLVLDGRGGAAAGLVVMLVLRRLGDGGMGRTNGVDGLAAVDAGVGLGDVACVEEAGYALAVLWDGQFSAQEERSGERTAGPEVGHLEMSQVQSARAAKGLVAAARVRRVARMIEAFILMVWGVCGAGKKRSGKLVA